MSQIYVIYRPEDSRKRSQEIILALQKRYGKSNIKSPDYNGYIDVYQIEEAVKKTNYLIVVIGNYWSDIVDEQGKNLLHSVYDPVHMAIATAIKSRKRIIPILTDGASMPRSSLLPRELRPLTRLEPITVEKNASVSKALNKGLKDIVKRNTLNQITDISKYFGTPSKPRKSTSPQQRLRQTPAQRQPRNWRQWLSYGVLPTAALVLIAISMAVMFVPNTVEVSVETVAEEPIVALATIEPTSTATTMTRRDSTVTESPVMIATLQRTTITVDNASQLEPIVSDVQNVAMSETFWFSQDESLFIFVSPELQEVQLVDVTTNELLRVLEFAPETPLYIALNPEETILYVLDGNGISTWGISEE